MDPVLLLLLVRLMDVWLLDVEFAVEQAQDEVEGLWRDTDPFDGDAVELFSRAAAEVSVRTQRAVVDSTAWVKRGSAEALGLDTGFVPNVPDDVRVFNPDYPMKYADPSVIIIGGEESLRVPTYEVFNRPARELRREIRRLEAEEDAFDPVVVQERAVKRVRDAVSMNATLAQRDTEMQYIEDIAERNRNVIGYRRVIHPERSLGGVCGLCLAASQRLYSRKDLKEIHFRCKCTVMEALKNVDPGFALNRQDLLNLYGLAGGTGADKLKQVRYRVSENGELGPVLKPAKGQTVEQFVSVPDIVDLDEVQRERKLAEIHLPKFEQRLQELLDKGLPRDAGPVQYHERMIKKFKKTLVPA